MNGEQLAKGNAIRQKIAAIDEKMKAYRAPCCDVLSAFWHDDHFKISEKNALREELRGRVLSSYQQERDQLEEEFALL